MDKIKINNQVVIMRKFVKQAKIRTINKFVKEIKLLQNRKGDEKQVLKCKRKADRLLSEVSLLRKIKPDAVSKMALSKAKDWKAILTQKNIPLEDRCFAILASYEPVQEEVEKFHSANYYLVSKIATLIEEWEEKAKLSSQNPQKNKKAFQSGKKALEKPGMESQTNFNKKKLSQIEEKPKTGNTQPKSLPHIKAKKPLEKEGNEMSDVGNNSSNSASEDVDESMEKDEMSDIGNNSSDSASEDVDESIEENEKFSDEDSLNETDSVKLVKLFQNRSDSLGSDSHHSETDSSSSDEESTTQISEEKGDCGSISPSADPFNKPRTSQESESILKPVKNNHKRPKKSSAEANKNTKEQPTFHKSFSPEPNSTKAVALINLNEMLDMDEIPIDNNRTTVEAVEETGKRKRDAFFLTGNSDDVSEGDNDEDSDDGRRETDQSPFRKKQQNSFNKRGSFNDRFKNGSDGFKRKQNLGSSPHTQKFGFREKGFKKNNKDFYSKEQSNNFGKNQGRERNSFNKNRFNNFEKTDRKPENRFNKNKKWNTVDKNDRTERKPFKNTSGKTFEKNVTNNKYRNDYSANKRESINKAGGKKEELPLHPSWEAKRKLKTPVNAKFQGKRVVFND